MKIRHQLSLITLFFLGIALILMSIFFYFHATNILQDKNRSFMNESLISGGMVLENLIEARRVETSYLAQNTLVLNAASDYYQKYQQDQIDNKPDYTTLNDYLYRIRTKGEGIRAAFVIGPDGSVIASGHLESIGLDLGDRNYFQEAMLGKETISNLLFDRLEGFASLFVASPILSNDNVIGVMTLIINTQSTSDTLRALISKENGDAYLINSDGMIIFHTDPTLIGSYHRDEKTRSYFFLRQLSVSGSWQYSYQGEDYYIVYSSLSNTPWTLVIEQNMSIYMAAVKETLWTLLAIFSLILLLAGTSYSLYAKHFTAPIQHLSKVMHQTTEGDLSVRSQYLSKNELGSLSKDLNLMLDELVGAYEETDAAKRQIEELAFLSPLTKVPNRTAYDYDLRSLFQNGNKPFSFSLIHIDIDNFMRINYSLGHQFGDAILIEFANKLKTFENDTIRLYHISADKFTYLIENTLLSTLTDFLCAMNNFFLTPLLIEQREIFLSLSMGISSYPEDGLSPELLKNHAEAALYEAKHTGKGQYVFYHKVMSEKVNRRIEIETLLRRAIKDRRLNMVYQPQYTAETNTLVSFEALMRLKAEDGKTISPAEFIPIAEDTGMIVDLSLWMFNEVFQQASRWISSDFPFDYVCVNISGRHLRQEGFSAALQEIAAKNQLAAHRIELEITESILIDLSPEILHMLNQLKELGFRIALDDFGTGYSSLSYLRSLPLSTLKIDKIFIDEITSSNKDQELVRQIIELAHELSLYVVAEGVETGEQLSLLSKYHCDLIQGYYFSKPLRVEDITLGPS